ncbi:MAG: DEAD/DEAH box helicase, partial [Halanaerobiales bacterium]
MNGRAILADEVGLGKTIEAGMILKEYLDRGLVKKSLILVPATLGFQWTNELVNKVGLNNVFFNRKGRAWDYFDHQIASLDLAKREEHARYLNQIDFDMLIVDEAHRLKNRKTLNWRFVNGLKKKYCLLLTATPIQNNLEELYSLIKILY